MLTPADADEAIAARLAALPAERVSLGEAAGRVLRTPVAADLDQPPFDRVAMDGIALSHAAHAAGRREFRIAGIVAAGARPPALDDPACCLEVMTGAVLPAGTDAVVPVEDLELHDGRATLRDRATVAPWINVHRRGLDARAGDPLLAPGTVLRGPDVAIAAAAGLDALSVGRRPRLAVISTGDELVPPTVRPEPWQVRRSNAFGIVALLATRGYRDVRDAHVRDDPQALRDLIGSCLEERDVLVLSGGVSAGRFDHVPAALESVGVRCVFHKIAQRPGKPLWFGQRADGRLVFALPGNPVSTLVCLVRYVLPALARLEGATPTPPDQACLDRAWPARPGLTTFLPVTRRRGAVEVSPHPTHGSGDFTSLRGTLGVVELAPGSPGEPGRPVPLYTW